MTTDPFERALAADRRRRAERLRAAEVTGFRIHLAVYVIVQALLVAVWWATGAGFQWFWFPLLGWGIGLAVHAAVVYRPRPELETS
jgi:hypothetical protein